MMFRVVNVDITISRRSFMFSRCLKLSICLPDVESLAVGTTTRYKQCIISEAMRASE